VPAPEHYVYELFLDDKGQKISKSKGNGLTIDEWLTYADPNSLALYMFQKPREAKRLYFDVIPRAVDEYDAFLNAYQRQDNDPAAQLMNPVWHIHGGHPPKPDGAGLSFSLLLNLATVANTEDKAVMWAFIKRYKPELLPETHPRLDSLVGYAIRYYQDFVKPAKKYRAADAGETEALSALAAAIATLPEGSTPEEIQQKVYDVGRREPYTTTQKDGSIGVAQSWFNMLYQVLLGEEKGPRFGSFAALYGVGNTVKLIESALKGALVKG
jgi:lysyl-tRNA synthetase, class I